MSSKPPSPWLLGILHKDWRPHQYNAIEAIEKSFKNKPIAILEAPTGTGKTAIATAISHKIGKTTVVVQNLGLLEQYEEYGFNILKGKQAYPCAHPDKNREWMAKKGHIATAADCHFPEMYQCPFAKSCQYVLARDKALASQHMACTYKYAALSGKVQKRDGLFVMDEIHNAVSEILSIGSFEMDDLERQKHDMPDFVLKDHGDGEGALISDIDREEVIRWITESMMCLGNMNLFDQITPEGAEKRKVLERFQSLIELMTVCRDTIFYKCSKKEVFIAGRKKKINKIEFKTTSPSYLYHKMSGEKDNVLMMSATIGNPTALIASEIHISKDNFDYYKFPHPVPPDRRPTYDIANHAMTHGNLYKRPWLYDKQAKDIAAWIQVYTNRDWRGIVLTTSYKKIEELRDGLKKYLGNDRVFENGGGSLQERIDHFVNNSDKGIVHVDTLQGWGTGIDLKGDIARYSVVAGVLFPNPTDAFEAIRMNTQSGRMYLTAFAYNSVMQATGRVSRGEKDGDEYMLNVSALADKMTTSKIAMSHYSNWFKESIVRP